MAILLAVKMGKYYYPPHQEHYSWTIVVPKSIDVVYSKKRAEGEQKRNTRGERRNWLEKFHPCSASV
jgi:hypothetical protein